MTSRQQHYLTIQFVEHRPLSEVCLALAKEVLMGHKPDGTLFAQLAKRLMAAEVRTGGPYYSADKSIEFFTNLAIGYLFACLKKPLPNVDDYIAAERKKVPLDEATKELLAAYDQQHTSLRTVAASQEALSSAYAQVEAQFLALEKPLRLPATAFLKRLKAADKTQEIALFPTIFYNSLISPFSFPPLGLLGEANIYTWIAYTIYDHLLDGESAIKYLPVANVAMRCALSRYQNIFPAHHSFQQKVANVFTDMDSANSWELSNARFKKEATRLTIGTLPAYGRCDILAKRSYAHALGPLAIASLATLSSTSLECIEKGLRHYLIARQLNDDLQDGQRDFRRGQATVVVSYILKRLKIKPGSYEIEALVERMQSNFWSHSMQAMTTAIHRHVGL